MENNPPKTGKFALNYGLILGGLGVVFGLMLYFQDAHTVQSTMSQVISMVLLIGVIFWGIINFKKANGGYLKMGEALKLGAGIGLVAAIISVIYLAFLSNVLDPDFAAKATEARLAEAADEMNLTPEQMAQQQEMGEKFFWIGYPIILIVNTLLGLIVGLVGGLIFKKSQD